jgi:hypothetical protein
MSIIDVIFSPLGIGLISVLVIGGGAVVYYLKFMQGIGSGTKKVLILLRPGEKRGLEIPIVKETASWLYCKTVEEVPRKFFKVAPGYVFPNVTKFFAVEGVGYTADAKLPTNLAPETATLDKALRILWGDEKYEKMPKSNRRLVEDTRWGLTIAVEAFEDETLPNISSEALREKDDEAILHILAEDAKNAASKAKFDLQQILIGAGAGALFTYIFINQGWLKVAGG